MFLLLQGHLAHKNPPPPQGPGSRASLGTYGDPMGVGVSYERGTPVLLSIQVLGGSHAWGCVIQKSTSLNANLRI